MVLNGEQNETLWVLPQDGLVHLIRMQAGSLGRLFLFLDIFFCCSMFGIDLLCYGGDVGVILFVRGTQIQLLDWRLHFEGFDSRGSLWSKPKLA